MIAIIRRLLILLVRVLVGARSDWRGCAPDPRRRIYFANHSSHFDTVAVMAALPWLIRRLTHPVAASDYWGSTGFRKFIAETCLRAVLVDRKPRVHSDPLGPLERLLEEHRSILIFPEGTRGADEILAFRSGLFHLARRFPDVDLVPIYLDNLSRILPKGSWLVVPITCTARFGTPLRLMPGEEKAAFLTRAREAVIGLSDGHATP